MTLPVRDGIFCGKFSISTLCAYGTVMIKRFLMNKIGTTKFKQFLGILEKLKG